MNALAGKAREKEVAERQQSSRRGAGRLICAALGFSLIAFASEPKQVPLTAEQTQAIQSLNQRAGQLQKERADFERATAAEGKVLQLEYERFLERECHAAGGDVCGIKTADDKGQALPPDKWLLVVAKKEPPKK